MVYVTDNAFETQGSREDSRRTGRFSDGCLAGPPVWKPDCLQCDCFFGFDLFYAVIRRLSQPALEVGKERHLHFLGHDDPALVHEGSSLPLLLSLYNVHSIEQVRIPGSTFCPKSGHTLLASTLPQLHLANLTWNSSTLIAQAVPHRKVAGVSKASCRETHFRGRHGSTIPHAQAHRGKPTELRKVTQYHSPISKLSQQARS